MKGNINIAMSAIGFVIIIVLMWEFLVWTEKRDVEIMQWAEKYEKCVQEEYNRTPATWYLEHGYYPEVINCN